MSLQMVRTDLAPAAIGPYSQAVRTGSLLFVSGQIPINPATGDLVGDEFAAQSLQSLKNVGAILAAAGCALTDVVAVDVFVTDMGRFAEFNKIYEEFFGAHKPARAVVEVSALPKGAKVEVKCVASVPA